MGGRSTTALTNHLVANAGHFKLGGDGWVRGSQFEHTDHTGSVELQGSSAAACRQARTQPAGALTAETGLPRSGVGWHRVAHRTGELVVEIDGHQGEERYGRLDVGQAHLNNSSSQFPDRWRIDAGCRLRPADYLPESSGTVVTGVDSVEYRLNSAPLPADWFADGSHANWSRAAVTG